MSTKTELRNVSYTRIKSAEYEKRLEKERREYIEKEKEQYRNDFNTKVDNAAISSSYIFGTEGWDGKDIDDFCREFEKKGFKTNVLMIETQEKYINVM